MDGVTWYYSISGNEDQIVAGSVKYAGDLSTPSTLGGCPVTSIGSSAFYNCSGLMSITIRDGVANIESSAFEGCSGMTSVVIPVSVTNIGASAFVGCNGLRSVIIPGSVTNIESAAFSGCSGLKTITIPAGVVGVGEYVFDDCTDDGVLYDKAKTRLIKYPCAVTTARYAVPASVTDIDEGAFAFTSTLTELTFGGDVDTIGDSAFDWCLGLRQVTFNGEVNFIGDGAFMVCPSLESLSFKGDSPLWGGNQFWYSTPTVYAERGTAGWDDAAANVGFVVSYIDSGETSVPKSWIDQYPEFLAAAGGDYEAAANSVGANGVTLRESYVAGLDPTDEKSKFTVNLTIVDYRGVHWWWRQGCFSRFNGTI